MADEKVCPKCAVTYPGTVVFCPDDGTVLQARDGDPLIGTLIADRYRVIARIGEGGMGQVYLAEHVHMRRRCAIKFLNPDLVGNDFAMKRFMREAENASRIDHPNVVTMYDFGQLPDGGVYLAMEFVDGESLRKRVERVGVLDPELIASVVRQTASALQAAHALQIVHRDLKPDNIMLIERGDELRVKVVDFGIAKAKDPRQKVTVTGAIVGTPDYMSPEQVTADETDGRSDQYALALVAVKMLTGKLPFASTTGVESLTSRLFSEPVPLRSLRADVAWPQQLQDVINRALSPKPDDRYPTVVDFAKAFDRALATIQGAVAATMPEISIADVVPPTRVSAPASPVPARPSRAPRTPWLMAAALAVVVVGGGSTWLLLAGDAQTVSPLNLPLADSVRPIAPESTVRLQSEPPASAPITGASTAAVTETSGSSVAGAAPVAGAGARRVSSPTPAPQAATPAPAAAPTATRTQRDSTPAAASRSAQAPQTPAPDTTSRGAGAAASAAPQPAATPQGLSSADVGTELARVRPMMTQQASRAEVDGALAALDRMLPRVTQRSDSIRILYTRAQGAALVDDLPGACRSLGRALSLASGSRLEETIARTARDLSCP